MSSGHEPGSLGRALEYRNDQVVFKFLERFEMAFEEGLALFDHVKTWIWLCARACARGRALVVSQELAIVDEMWHTFILFTSDYAAYCDRYIGRFVHHAPTTHADKLARRRERECDPEGVRRRARAILREQFDFIADELGAETLFEWFVELPRRYGPAFFERAARPATPSLSSQYIARLDELAADYRGGSSSSSER